MDRENILRALKPIADAAWRCEYYGSPQSDAIVYAESGNTTYELLKGEEGALDQTQLTVADLHAVREIYNILFSE